MTRSPYLGDVEELPDNLKWIEAITSSVKNLIMELQDVLKSRFDKNAMDTSSDKPREFSHIWARLEVLPSLILRGRVPDELGDALISLMHNLLQYCNQMGYQHSLAALYGRVLSMIPTLGLPNMNEEEAWTFFQNALPITGELIPLLQGANDFMQTYEKYVSLYYTSRALF